MVTIICDKCGIESNGDADFLSVHFTFTKTDGSSGIRQLCGNCQVKLRELLLEEISLFMGDSSFVEWKKASGIGMGA